MWRPLTHGVPLFRAYALYSSYMLGEKHGAAMAFILRTVVREATGKTGVVIERIVLGALTLADAKREADSRSWVLHGIEPNALEIIDGNGSIVAQRSYRGKNVYAPWT